MVESDIEMTGRGSTNVTPPDVNLDSSVTARPSSPSTKPASSTKPRSTKPAKPPRSPSPSPPPALPPVPFQTIRLRIQLGGPSNYEVDIARQAKDTGQRPPTPPVVVKKVADSGSDSEDDGGDKDDKSKTKKKKVGKIPLCSSHGYSSDKFNTEEKCRFRVL